MAAESTPRPLPQSAGGGWRADPLARLALVLHFHQPVGNLDDVIHRCCDRCYAPFLKSLEGNPDIVATLHFSGALLEWLEQQRPELTTQLGRLAARGQIELQTGGFYEPILAVLPPEDVAEQIRLQTDYLRERFGAQATGLWLTERVWEPHLPEMLAKAGVRYVTLDDTIFRSAGLAQDDLVGAFETEHLGRTIRVYPGAKKLRYTIPFQKPEETIALLRAAGERERGALLVYADDGEKFGEWPHTAETVYGERWLERFYAALREARDWLQLVKLGEHDAEAPSRGRVYLPTASYDEMMTWTLPPDVQPRITALMRDLDRRPDADAVRPFVRGGTWRAFFARYPESDHLHKRILQAGRRIAAMPAGPPRAEAQRDLYRAECNCAFWHGVFGGLYLVHLRNALWKHLIRAEAIMDEAVHGAGPWADAGTDSVRTDLRTERAVAIVDFEEGGTLIELDHRPAGVNVLSVIARRPEAYHAEISRAATADEAASGKSIHDATLIKEGVRDVVLAYDTHRRGALIDWAIGEDVKRGVYGSAAWNRHARRLALPFSLSPGSDASKQVMMRGGRLMAAYRVDGLPSAERLGVECNFQLGDPGASGRTITASGREPTSFAASGELREVTDVRIRERAHGPAVDVRISVPSDVWWFPVETVSASEAGLEKTPQGTSFLFLPSARAFTLEIELREP